MAVEKAISQNSTDDPPGMHLSAIRSFCGANGGIEAGTDSIEFMGVEFLIQKIEPCNVWNNMPSKFKLTLRRIGQS